MLTDHKPLTFAIASAVDRSPRQTRHLSYIAEFTTDIRHVAGSSNVVADALSRSLESAEPATLCMAAITEQQGMDYRQLAKDQRASKEIDAYRTAITGLHLQEVPLVGSADTLLCDVTMAKPRPVLPTEWTRVAFDAIHGLGHAGTRPTLRAMASKFVWHGMKRDVRAWCRACHPCQISKVGRHIRAPLQQRTPPDGRFTSVHIDIVGPLPPSEGFRYLLTIVDRFSRWPEAVPLADVTAHACASAFIRTWVARFGVPSDITSDRGPQFTSQLWTALTAALGTVAHKTTAYHPQANGMVERIHRQLKASLQARMNGPGGMDHLPLVLLHLRTAWREDPDCTAAELVYGTNLTLPGDFVGDAAIDRQAEPTHDFAARLRKDMSELSEPDTVYHGEQEAHVPRSLAQAAWVYVRQDAHRPPYRRTTKDHSR